MSLKVIHNGRGIGADPRTLDLATLEKAGHKKRPLLRTLEINVKTVVVAI